MQPPKNRDELEAMAEELQGQGITPVAAGIGDDPAAIEWFPTVFWNHYSGPDALYQALTGEIPFSEPIFVEAIELFNDYVQKGWFGGSTREVLLQPIRRLARRPRRRQGRNQHRRLLVPRDHRGLTSRTRATSGTGPRCPRCVREYRPNSTSSASGLRYPSTSGRGRRRRGGVYRLPDGGQEASRRVDGGRALGIQRAVAFHQSDFPSSMDPRVARQLAALSEATAKGNFGYTAWTFWPSKSDVYIQEESQKVLTGDITAAEFCEGLDEQFTQDARKAPYPRSSSRGAPSGAGERRGRAGWPGEAVLEASAKAQASPDGLALHGPAAGHQRARHHRSIRGDHLLLVHRVVGHRACRVGWAAELQGSPRRHRLLEAMWHNVSGLCSSSRSR